MGPDEFLQTCIMIDALLRKLSTIPSEDYGGDTSQSISAQLHSDGRVTIQGYVDGYFEIQNHQCEWVSS